MQKKRLDLTGQIFGKLTAISFSYTDKHGYAHWNCKCSCGNFTEVKGSRLRSGTTKSCGCLIPESTVKRFTGNTYRRLEKGEAGFRIFYRNCKNRAKRSDIFFDDSEKFKNLLRKISQEKCTYCGLEPSQVSKPFGGSFTKEGLENSKFTHSGIDRVDSSKGYEFENVVSSCKYCNYAKMDRSQEEFEQHVKQIFKHRGLK